jgi:hypothetical protein
MRRLLDAIRDGVTSEDLAGRFGIERSMVQKIARRNGLVLGKGNGW